MRFFYWVILAQAIVLFTFSSRLFAQNVPTSSTPSTVVPVAVPSAHTGTSINYVRTYEPVAPFADAAHVTAPSRTTSEVRQKTEYFDGLGRPIQAVTKAVSPNGFDMVAPVIYDAYGREQYKYLPYVQQTGNTNDGNFKKDPFPAQQAFYKSAALNPGTADQAVFYSLDEYEASPLNRIVKKYASGDSWAKEGGNKPTETRYLINEAADSVRIWRSTLGNPLSTSIFPAGTLHKNVTVDEIANQRIEYVDNEGRILLRKVQSAAQFTAHAGWLCTYYVYDDYGNLQFLITPQAVEHVMRNNWVISDAVANGLCFQYQYDERNRMISKKTPDAGQVDMVYDVRDRLVFTQNAVQKSKSEWLVNFYDALNRPVMTAIYKSNADRSVLQSSLNTATSSQSSFTFSVPPPNELELEVYDGRSAYNAAKSITLLPTFSTNDGAEVSFYIDASSSNSTTVVATNPLPGISSDMLTPLTYTYYDNYDYAGALPYSGSDAAKTEAGSNPYAENPVPAKGGEKKRMVTGKRVRVLESDKWLTTTNYYDDKGKLIQELVENNVGGYTITSTRYDFSGKVISTYFRQKNPRSSLTPQISLLTTMSYDAGGRLLAIKKRLNDKQNTEQTIVSNKYDELGRLIQKRLGVTGSTTQLDTITYTYNIRGWLSGINRAYVRNSNNTSNWFGQEYNYDNGFSVPQYSGNISGIKWRSRSSNIVRAFGYSYDKTNRIAAADYRQQNIEAANWTKDIADFSVGYISYDANGNLLKMEQNGMIGKTISTVDNLSYSYQPFTNKLSTVAETGNNTIDTELGDFTNSANPTNAAYTYDLNGNLSVDPNKGIDGITYNHLNLPVSVTVKNKGKISYDYDADGTRLRKTVEETIGGSVITTVTDYIAGAIYVRDSLQLLGHEEGRIRTVYKAGRDLDYAIDYFEKDQQGNVRVILGSRSDTSIYTATIEAAASARENALFGNIDNTRTAIPQGYPTDNTTNPNAYIARLNARNGNMVGPSIVLRVMAGDTIQIGATAFYKTPPTTTPYASSSQIISALLNALSGQTVNDGVHGSVGAGSPVATSLNVSTYDYLKQKDPENSQPGKPRAYLNFVMFDDQFKMVDENSGVRQVNEGPDALLALTVNKTVVKKTGFLYVYTSNEMDYDVFFDNLIIVHNNGPLIEETHYYPFGLTISSISASSLNGTIKQNKFKYAGKELEHNEFLNGSGLELYDFGARMQDPQLGRFWQVDPKSETFFNSSPYSYCLNNPIIFVDPDGMAAQYTYDWQTGRYQDSEGEDVPFSEVEQFLRTGAYSRSFDVMIFGKDKPGGKNQILGDNHGNTLWLSLSYARKSANGSVKILQVEDADDAAKQIEQLNGSVRNLFMISHGDASSAEGHQAFFSIGRQAFQAKDIAGSAAFTRIGARLTQTPGPLPTAVQVIIFSCGAGGLYNHGDELLTAVAKKLHATVFGPQGFGLAGATLFDSRPGSQELPISGHDSKDYDEAKRNQGNFTKVSPYGVGAYRVETVKHAYFDSFGRLHYSN